MDPPRAQQRTFRRNAHVAYFQRCLRALPTAAQGHDPNRITIAYFCLSALDLLGALDDHVALEQRQSWADWIWSLQSPSGGFRGSPYMTTLDDHTSPPHLPSTYTALMTLAVLRAPLDRLNVPGLISFISSCQCPDGSFSPLPAADEYISAGFQNDVRMSYCANVVADVIDAGLPTQTQTDFIARCKTWEGGYASRPGVIESQGGTTYCSVAALSMMGTIPEEPAASIRWLLQRQIGGFQGRPGKLEDVCYSFWCGAAITILGHAGLINAEADRAFLLAAQSPLGGFGKEPDDYPDPFHSYLALAALALSHQDGGLKQLDPRWNVSRETANWLREEMIRVA
ncbi:hypothetical protein EHS25_002028 [Saitozyma podzolica]|uniref:Prenyltransferase alpha-alpha toroid domain-containing protein n=1 Tax=Saitozyma podzolica TaxID=1890683 RepID=A0A427YE84_9TREE|nr:hypothetical protein EHS25_002028 [Saitozyma podzolica]